MITLTVTPTQNVDYEAKQVIDSSKIAKRNYEWETPILVLDAKENRQETVKAGNISLYDHRIIEGQETLHILHFYSIG